MYNQQYEKPEHIRAFLLYLKTNIIKGERLLPSQARVCAYLPLRLVKRISLRIIKNNPPEEDCFL